MGSAKVSLSISNHQSLPNHKAVIRRSYAFHSPSNIGVPFLRGISPRWMRFLKSPAQMNLVPGHMPSLHNSLILLGSCQHGLTVG